MKRAAFLTLFLILAAFANAQQEVRRPPLPPVAINVDGKAAPIQIAVMDIKVDILSNIAVTRYDITFYNPNNRILEGEFDFAMTESQSVSAFALDVNGKMRDGVPVEKAKGRAVFEEIVRRDVDPGLLEKTAGNHFKTRIYPLPAKGTRRVQITTEEKLRMGEGGYNYLLPLDFKQVIGDFSLRVDVIKQSAAPKVQESPLNTFKFAAWNDSYTASLRVKDYPFAGKLSFAVPAENIAKVYSYDADGSTYFFAAVPVAAQAAQQNKFGEVTLIWDASSSAERADKDAYFDFLDKFFDVYKEIKVNFISFNIEAAPAKGFRIFKGDWRALKAHIESLPYDGGANTKALESLKPAGAAVLFFGDGLDSFGQESIPDFKIKTYSLSASSSYNQGVLQNMALKTGGLFINLNEIPAQQAVKNVAQDYKLASITYDKTRFEEVYPAAPVPAQGIITVAGIMSVKEASLDVNFTAGDKAADKQRVYINKKNANPLARSVFAREKIAHLALGGVQHKDAIIELGKKFNIVTEYTSLIVLEDINDYVKNQIAPPAELRAEYNRLLAEAARQKTNKEKDVLEEALNEFNALKKWWKKDFPKTKPAASPRPQEAPMPEASPLDGEGVVFPTLPVARASDASEMASAPAVRHDVVSEEYVAAEASAPAAFRSAVNLMTRRSNTAMEEAAPARKPAAVIRIEAWQPDMPYLREIKKSAKKDYYKKYLELKKDYKEQPSFYLDMAAFFQQQGDIKTAILIISNAAGLKTDSPELLRITAQKLLELGEYKLALSLFQYITELRGEEPQSFRDLAFASAQSGRYQDALDNYYKVITGDWSGRFQGIKSVVFNELNELISRYQNKLNIRKIDPRFIFPMPVDVRIALGWSSDSTDIDLHVKDPFGEECYYGHNLTHTGGKMTDDITQGYGPEEFTIKNAVEGEYKVSTNYFSDSRQSITGPVTLYLDLYTYYGTPRQKHKRLIIRADSVKDRGDIGTLTFGNPPPKKEADAKAAPPAGEEPVRLPPFHATEEVPPIISPYDMTIDSGIYLR